jgi:DNA mismatch repair protein MutS2
MIYPETFEAKLGVDQIRLKLKQYCLSPAGQAWVDNMRFSTDYDFINILLTQNLEFRLILEKGETFPSQHFVDPADWIKKISLEGNWLEADEFLSLAYGIETILACKTFLSKNAEIYPQLHLLSQPVSLSSQLSQRVHATIDDKRS